MGAFRGAGVQSSTGFSPFGVYASPSENRMLFGFQPINRLPKPCLPRGFGQPMFQKWRGFWEQGLRVNAKPLSRNKKYQNGSICVQEMQSVEHHGLLASTFMTVGGATYGTRREATPLDSLLCSFEQAAGHQSLIHRHGCIHLLQTA